MTGHRGEDGRAVQDVWGTSVVSSIKGKEAPWKLGFQRGLEDGESDLGRSRGYVFGSLKKTMSNRQLAVLLLMTSNSM